MSATNKKDLTAGGADDLSLRDVLRHLGPGVVLSGSIVGSGELIITTRLGAEYGFALLWAVVICCTIKAAIQIELTRYCIVNTCTPIQALSRLPGPRLRGVSWIVLVFFVGLLLLTVALAGILAAVGELLADVWPQGIPSVPIRPAAMFNVLVACSIVLLLRRGGYKVVEIATTALVASFSAVVVGALLQVQRSASFAITWSNIAQGFSFAIPEGSGLVLVALMGAVGITPTEIFFYPYWALEAGYGGGNTENTSEEHLRNQRNRWIRIMKIDVFVGTLITLMMTVSYYLLGAAVLHRHGLLPSRGRVVHDLAGMFTATYGEWSYALFMFGAFCTLYSTVLVFAASSGRIWSDLLMQLGVADGGEQARRLWQRRLQNVFVGVQLLFALVTVRALLMIRTGAIIDALMLPIFAVAAAVLARRMPRAERVGPFAYAVLIVTAVASVAYVIVVGARELF